MAMCFPKFQFRVFFGSHHSSTPLSSQWNLGMGPMTLQVGFFFDSPRRVELDDPDAVRVLDPVVEVVGVEVDDAGALGVERGGERGQRQRQEHRGQGAHRGWIDERVGNETRRQLRQRERIDPGADTAVFLQQ